MSSVFDIVTVTCFAILVGAFFQLTDRRPRTMMHFVLAGVVFAVANQVGNSGAPLLASVLIAAGVGYAAIVTRSSPSIGGNGA